MTVAAGSFTEVLLTAPVGVALLAGMEATHRPEVGFFERMVGSRPEAVAAAVDAVGLMSMGELLSDVLGFADSVAGPWNPSSLVELPEAYASAPDRRLIAEAVSERFASELSGTLDRSAQQWWNASAELEDLPLARVYLHAGEVYCCGEWPMRHVWSVTSPPPKAHGDLVMAWELRGSFVGRWHVGVDESARVFEIDGVDDWARLVSTYPKGASLRHSGWELPGSHPQHDDDVESVVAASDGRAARRDVRVLMPDWNRVAKDWDGVQLSWAGMIGCEGHVVDLPEFGERAVTMLRYWASERTLWLRSSSMASAAGMVAPDIANGMQAASISTIDSPAPDFARWPI